jgi:hypothetical protein
VEKSIDKLYDQHTVDLCSVTPVRSIILTIVAHAFETPFKQKCITLKPKMMYGKEQFWTVEMYVH